MSPDEGLARERQILDCGLPRHLKNLLLRMYRHGGWVSGEGITVSNETLARELSLSMKVNKEGVPHGVRSVQINKGILMHMSILKADGAELPTRQRNAYRDVTVKTARRGGGAPTTFRIQFDRLPPPIPIEWRTGDRPSLFADEAACERQGGELEIAPGTICGSPQGRSGDRPRGDLEIARSSLRPDRSDVRTATADAAAFPGLGPIKTEPEIDRGRLRSTPRRLAQEPNGDNYRVLERLAWEVLQEPGRQWRCIGELVKSESDLVAAVKEFAAGKRVSYAEGDAVYRACASVWLKFTLPGVVAGREARLRDRAHRRMVR